MKKNISKASVTEKLLTVHLSDFREMKQFFSPLEQSLSDLHCWLNQKHCGCGEGRTGQSFLGP
jgi:hypothetical protein